MTKCVDDLSARARRGGLDETEQRQLRRLLTASAEARLMHRAGLGFDAEDCVLPGDDELAARIEQRLLPPSARSTRRHRLPVGVWMAAAILAIAGATAAAGPVVIRVVESVLRGAPDVGPKADPRARPTTQSVPRTLPPSETEPPSSSPAPSAPDERTRESTPQLNPTELGDAVTERAARARHTENAARAETNPRVAVQPATSAANSAYAEPVEPDSQAVARFPGLVEDSAGAAYAEANRRRRAGDPSRAIALYESIQRRFPNSVEAVAAEIPLGVLQLQVGALNAAKRHFRGYLARAPNGQLAPDALWGLAEAHWKAGQTEAAAGVWSEIVDRYPNSAYAAAARAKLRNDRKRNLP